MMSIKQKLTGKPSIDRPWLQYYPKELIENLSVPDTTVYEYLMQNCPGDDVAAIHYYGRDITWKEIKEETDKVARSLRAIGFGEGDEIPMFLKSVPEFICLLLAAEKIGASLLCRDNTIEENVAAVEKAGAKMIFAHDFLSQEDFNKFRAVGVRGVVLLSPIRSADRSTIPDYSWDFLDSNYTDHPAYGPCTMSWDEFLELGKTFTGQVDAPKDIHRPLFRAYTSGSTGPSKQVIHCAYSMVGTVHQMNFYGSSDEFRPTWMVTLLPPSLVAVVVSMVLLPLSSNKLLILCPFVAAEDVDLEMMRYRPNCWPLIPMFIELVMRNGRVPDDYDLSHLISAGAGCEAYNNNQLKRAQKFLDDHNCKARFTAGYGCSEAGSNMGLPMPTPHPIGNGNVGIPMPLTTISIFKPNTEEECTYNQLGEICQCGPGTMMGYDNKKATDNAIKTHSDGKRWLHTGDIGYMTEDGTIFALTRGNAPRYGGGDLATLPMENLLADAEIPGIDDEFFVIIPDEEHHRCFVPYLFVVLKDGYTIDDIRENVADCLEPYMQPVDIIALDERPFFHFKTNRIGLTQDILDGKFE